MAKIEDDAPFPQPDGVASGGNGVPQPGGALDTTGMADELADGIAAVLMAMRSTDGAAGAAETTVDPEPANAATRRLLGELDRLWRAPG